MKHTYLDTWYRRVRTVSRENVFPERWEDRKIMQRSMQGNLGGLELHSVRFLVYKKSSTSGSPDKIYSAFRTLLSTIQEVNYK